ncbi:MAG: norG, partial [Microbacterium sp.]|nr:norG [Microbacterium sp.]
MSARALAQSLGGWRTREPAYEALADGIRLLCLDNRLAPRTTLPAERELAGALQVSRSTVAAAYRSLRETAHIASLRGSGSVTLPLRRRDPGRVEAADGMIDLQQASPPAWPGLAGIMSQTAANASALVSRVGYDVLGRIELREAIARRYTERGVPTHPDEVLVTTGAQSAIHLVSSVLIGRGDRVLVETPTYPHAADALRRAGARLVGVPVTTQDGWDLDRAEQAFARTLPVMAYLMPDFQNPTGRSMTARERHSLLAAGERSGSVLVLDETTADLDIDRGSLAPGFESSEPGTVVRIGSLGKTVWGGLRLGWVRADGELIGRLVAARPAHDLGTPEFEQAIATRLLAHFDDILLQRSELLRAGRDALVETLRSVIPSWDVPVVHGGVSLWIELGSPLSSARTPSACAVHRAAGRDGARRERARRGLGVGAGGCPVFDRGTGRLRHLIHPVGRHGSSRESQALDRLVSAPELADIAERLRWPVEAACTEADAAGMRHLLQVPDDDAGGVQHAPQERRCGREAHARVRGECRRVGRSSFDDGGHGSSFCSNIPTTSDIARVRGFRRFLPRRRSARAVPRSPCARIGRRPVAPGWTHCRRPRARGAGGTTGDGPRDDRWDNDMSDRADTITITGNVATPPELKRTPSGVAIATFRVA